MFALISNQQNKGVQAGWLKNVAKNAQQTFFEVSSNRIGRNFQKVLVLMCTTCMQKLANGSFGPQNAAKKEGCLVVLRIFSKMSPSPLHPSVYILSAVIKAIPCLWDDYKQLDTPGCVASTPGFHNYTCTHTHNYLSFQRRNEIQMAQHIIWMLKQNAQCANMSYIKINDENGANNSSISISYMWRLIWTSNVYSFL